MRTPPPLRTSVLTLAAFLAFGALPSLQAQTTYNATLNNSITNIYGSIWPNSSPHYDAINFATGNGTLLYVDQNVDFNGSALSNVFTSTTFTSTGGRVAASILGTDELTNPVDGRTFIVKNFALENVDFTTSAGTIGDVELRIQGLDGGNTILSLANSSISSTITPHLYAPSALAFNVSGSSQITGWKGHMSSATTLDIASGGTLRIKDSGSLTPVSLSETLYFNQGANHAILNNSSLILDTSNLRWGLSSGSGSEMTLTNNSSLQLVGQSKFWTHDAVVRNSSITMDNNTRIDVVGIMELDNSTASVASGASIHTSSLTAKGNATASLGVGGNVYVQTLYIEEGATMTAVGNSYDIGEMSVTGQVIFQGNATGTLAVGDHAVLNLSGNATSDLTNHSNLTTTSLAEINMQEAKVILRQGSSFTNNGVLTVQAPSSVSIDGNVAIAGAGTTDMRGSLTFADAAARGNNTLTTRNQLDLGSTAKLYMALDATALTSDTILIDNGAHEFTINTSATLNLSVVNDTVLALGTKFLLINYPDWQVAMGAHFSGLVDGAIFALGLNTYQINYNDEDYRPAEGSTFITVTTVPEPSTWALIGLGSFAFAGRALRRRS
jgi:hypothetical protein